MNCQEFQEQLNRFLDGETVDLRSSLVRDHARQCLSCRELQGAAELLHHRFQAEPAAAPADFADAVVRAVLRERRQRNILRWSLATAAAVAGLSLTAWLARLWLSEPVQHEVALPSMEREVESPQETMAIPSLSEQAREAGATTWHWARLVTQDTAKQADALSAPPLAPSNLSATTRPGQETVRKVGQTVAEGFEPVTQSTRRAVDVWLHMLPMGTDDKAGS
jgi:hypothetical protein